MVTSSTGKKDLRSFTVIDARHVDSCKTKFLVKGEAGRYVSRNPASAAKKAFSQLCRVKRIKGQCALYICLRETTQNSNDRVFTYKLNRRKLAEPIVVSEDRPPIQYETRIKSVKSLPDNCKKSRKSSGPMKAKKSKSQKSLRHNSNNNNKGKKTKKRKH